MNKLGIQGVWRGKNKQTTRSRDDQKRAPDLVKRNFNADHPNPCEAILCEYGLNEAAVIRLMRQNMKLSSFKMWRARMTGRKTKHLQLRSPDVIRAYCSRQYKRF